MNGPELKQRREAAGMSRADLADALGTSARSVYRWEDGTHPISERTAIAVDTILGPVTVRSQSVPRRSVKPSK